MSGVVSASQSLIEASIIASFFETTFVRRVMRPRWWRVLLLSRSMVTVCALPMMWRSGGRILEKASQSSV